MLIMRGVIVVGIYMIRNTINDKKYIGQSSDILNRWTHHKCDLNNNQHHNNHLQSSWNLYGQDKFEFSIIEETTLDNLDSRERFWIDYYDSYYNGYNNDLGGQGCHGYKHSQEEIDKMRTIQNPEVVLQFDMNMQFIKEWIGGCSHVAKSLGYTKDCILSRCNHSIKKMSPYKNCYWIFKKEYESVDFSWDKYLDNIIQEVIKKDNIKNTKKIVQYTLDREVEMIWDSLSSIREKYGNTSSISAILYHRKGKKTAYGYIWAFEGYDFSDGYFDTLEKYYNKAIEKRKRKVAKIDPSNLSVIEIYDSLTDAAEHIGGVDKVSGICVASKGYPNHKCGGYLWKYIE